MLADSIGEPLPGQHEVRSGKCVQRAGERPIPGWRSRAIEPETPSVGRPRAMPWRNQHVVGATCQVTALWRRILKAGAAVRTPVAASGWPATLHRDGAAGRQNSHEDTPEAHAGSERDHTWTRKGGFAMYPTQEAREIEVLLRISREIDVCGDLTATVDNPSELIAWAGVLSDPAIVAWQASDSRCRFVQVSADHHRAPVRGRVVAVLACDGHPDFWRALDLVDLAAGHARSLTFEDLTRAWGAMPVTAPDSGPPQPPAGSGRAA